MSLMRTEGLSIRFGGVVAIDRLDFELEPGRVLSIIGPNGAGKTTLLNLITGVYRSTQGRIWHNGEDVTDLATHQIARRGVARTFQNLQVFYNMKAIENVMVGRHLHADSRFVATLFGLPGVRRSDRRCREDAAELLEFVGLSAIGEQSADSLPYGSLKRLEIARALAAKPDLLLLDEPAAGCNMTETAEIDRLIGRIVERGVTVILVEHDMRLVMSVSDHILVLDRGRKLAEGKPQDIRQNPEVIAAYLGAEADGGQHVA